MDILFCEYVTIFFAWDKGCDMIKPLNIEA